MVALVLPFLSRSAPREAVKPAPSKAVAGPVFVTDCVAPLQGTTLLHLLWQKWDQPPEDDATG